jgi:hypothetical protein
MKQALETFQANLERVRSIHTLHQHFLGMVAPIVDLSDLLRTEIVLLASALDHFIHELTRLGMIEVWQGSRKPTSAYLKFGVSLDVTTQLAAGVGTAVHLETEIRLRHSFLSFQQPDNIADAVRLFSPVELWNEVGAALGAPPKDVKAQLKLLVERRNKIAHEADIDPSFPGQRWPITRQDTESALDFVEKLGRAIYKVAV